MKQVVPFLSFNGNCAEAMQFYQSCLGGELQLTTIGQTVMADAFPPSMHQLVVTGNLVASAFCITASDLNHETKRFSGTHQQLLLNCSSLNEARSCYLRLSEGGRKISDLQFHKPKQLSGQLIDKFGNGWIINWINVTFRSSILHS